MVEKVITATCEFYMDENLVLHIIVLPNAKIDFEDALDNALVIRHLTNGRRVLKLTDSRNYWSITKRGKQVVFKENDRQTLARAIVVTNTLSSSIRNLFLKMHSQDIPIKFFGSDDAAYEWLVNCGKGLSV